MRGPAKQTRQPMMRGTCEAGGRIKPGAQAPGSRKNKEMEPAKRASALSPAFAGTGELAAPETVRSAVLDHGALEGVMLTVSL
jgi:hypothetical protein